MDNPQGVFILIILAGMLIYSVFLFVMMIKYPVNKIPKPNKPEKKVDLYEEYKIPEKCEYKFEDGVWSVSWTDSGMTYKFARDLEGNYQYEERPKIGRWSMWENFTNKKYTKEIDNLISKHRELHLANLEK